MLVNTSVCNVSWVLFVTQHCLLGLVAEMRCLLIAILAWRWILVFSMGCKYRGIV
ncbi:hypothetical protein XF_1039 [Xylella fastidiosa 9a5c]|uniref:Uncharacterized protein n=1 Tax=Xylella fastidiosa (strain 9a5c) TaxID=160492 RepID=Q9PEI9_XYLFA|nr:hypothetical protein XF_1039 [Xylella fastidiosa 9a5c]